MKKFVILAAGALFAAPVFAQNEVVPAAPAAAAPVAKPAPAAPAAAVPAATDGSVKAEIKIGTDIENREIVGEATSFAAGTPKLAAWTRITGAGQPTQIWHVWKRNGEELSKISLNVTSSYFRTYSRKDVNGQAGNWTLEVRDASGAVLASKDFTVGEATPK